jgi:diacylglycerol kinase
VHKKILRSFTFAISGVKEAFGREPNLKIHLAIATAILILAAILSFSVYEWALLAFTIFFVFILEFVNSALEAVVDLVSPELREEARVAKDISAACVLLSAVMSVAVGVILFLPKILALF